MSDFGLVAEGPTDWAVLESILIGACSWPEEPTIDPVELAPPLQDGKPSGGWTLVADYLRDKWHEALQFHRYVVVQVDTDIVADLWSHLGRSEPPLPTSEGVVVEVIAALSQLIDEAHRDRFFFAIGVDELECWLLGLVVDESQRGKRRKTTGCYALLRSDLSSPGKDKDHSRYVKLSKPLRKRRTLEELAALNPGFASFVDQLARVEPLAP